MDVNELLGQVEKKNKPPKKQEQKKKVSSQNRKDDSFNDVMESISNNWITNKSKNQDEISKLKQEIQFLRSELASNSSDRKYTANEQKIIAAIKSESINQNTNHPIIGRTMFLKKYKVSSRFLDKSINNLIGINVIIRKEVKYSQNIMTFSYEFI